MTRRHNQNSSGPSQRQLRVGEVIRRALADILNRGELHDPEIDRLSITVGEVRMSPDLRVATAHVMPLGGQQVELAITALARHKHELRRALNREIHLKFSPELRFVRDTTFDQMDETRRLLSQDRVRRDLERDGDDG